MTRTLTTALVGGLAAFLVMVLLGTGNSAPQDPPAPATLQDRVEQLEKRVAWLESQMGQLCAEDANLARINAEHQLAIIEERFKQTERLAAHGFVSAEQLQADRLALEIARRDVQLAGARTQNQEEAAHLEVLNAEAVLRQAELRHDHSQRLLAKGYVSQAQAAADAADVERARKVLEAARHKLEMLRKAGPPPAGNGHQSSRPQ